MERGSNERQFGCQKLNLPFITICRSKFGKYKQYHTSEDNLKIIKNKYLLDSVNKILTILKEIQKSKIFIKSTFCEPFLTKYNLINSVSKKENKEDNFSKNISNIIAYTDKNVDEIDLSNLLKVKISEVKKINKMLQKKKILKEFI